MNLDVLIASTQQARAQGIIFWGQVHASLWPSQGLATWSDEDFIGRVSRTNRKCHAIQQSWSTMKKCLINYKREWKANCRPKGPAVDG